MFGENTKIGQISSGADLETFISDMEKNLTYAAIFVTVLGALTVCFLLYKFYQ